MELMYTVNRQFIKMHFEDCDPVEKKFVTKNPFNGEPMVFIMDCKVQYMSCGVLLYSKIYYIRSVHPNAIFTSGL